MPASSAATELAINQINVRPAAPVVGAGNSVRLVIDVVAKGVRGRDGVSVKVEPGAPPGPVIDPTQQPSPSPRPSSPPSDGADDEPPPETWDEEWSDAEESSPDTWDEWPGTDESSSENAEEWSKSGDPPTDPNDGPRTDTKEGSRTDTKDGPRTERPAKRPAEPPTEAETRPDAESPTGRRPAKEEAPRAESSEGSSEEEAPPSEGTEDSSGEASSAEGAENSSQEASPAGAAEDSSGREASPSKKGGTPAAPEEGQVSPSVPVEAGSGQTARGASAVRKASAAPPVWSLTPSATRMSGGWQTWRFLPDKLLSRYYPAGTWTITATAKGPNGTSVTSYASFQLKRESKLGDVRVARAGAAQGVRLSGSLTRVDPRGATDFSPFARQRVEILWRQNSSGTWQRVAEATTTANGAFRRTVSGRTGGDWRVRYLGTGHYAPDASRIRQINQ